MIKAIAPIDVAETKESVLPDGVMEAWNARIAMNYCGGTSHVNQNDIIRDLCEKMQVGRDAVFKNKWLDVEPIYEASGWVVEYDKPAYYETYEASFTFTPKG